MASSVGPDMSKWQDEKAGRNRRAVERLSKNLPTIFPPVVLARALSRPFIPPTPRLAIDSRHAIRSDRRAGRTRSRSRDPARRCALDMARAAFGMWSANLSYDYFQAARSSCWVLRCGPSGRALIDQPELDAPANIGSAAATPTSAALRRNWQTPMEER
jgi:hypothetical protein